MSTATRTVLRILAHLVAEVPLVVVAALQISKGWVPTSDDAVIAWRTWSVFSGPLPLTGQFSQITAAHGPAAFDLGPLQYFLLAVPERIDPVHGILWGAALVAACLAAVSIEAMWSACGLVGGIVTSLALGLTVATLFQATVNLAWNPSTGVYATFATMATAVAVGCGRTRWLPAAVAAGSLAAQCHTSFALPAIAAIVVGIVMGRINRRDGWRWPLAAGAIAGTACWMAPLIQQITGHPGNWSVVLTSVGEHGRAVGFSRGLRGIASATRLLPSWWLRLPVLNTISGSTPFERSLYSGSALWGAAALAICAVSAVAAGLLRRPRLAAIAAIAATTGLAAAWTLGSVPVAQAPYLVYYLYFVLWPVGMAIAATFAWAVVALVAETWRFVGHPAEARDRSPDPGVPSAVAGWVLAIALAAAGAGLIGADLPLGGSPLFLMGWVPVHETETAVADSIPLLRAHETASSRAFDVEASKNFILFQSAVAEGVAYLLVAKGYLARVSGVADLPLGAPYRATGTEPALVLQLGFHGKVEVMWEAATRRTP